MLAILGAREIFGCFAQLQELRNALLDFRVRAAVNSLAGGVFV
jgi:hypothetical protein